MRRAPVVLAVSYLIGSIPFSGMLARWLKGVDLRNVGTGTVSGTGLYRVAGAGPLIIGGLLDVAKGGAGPLMAGSHRPGLRAMTAACVVVGHNWSVFLRGSGGRGISPALGAMAVTAPEGTLVILGGLAAGRASRATSLGALASYLALIPVLPRTRGGWGAATAAAVVAPMLLKRVMGNQPVQGSDRARTYVNRLLFDQDTPQWPRWLSTAEGGAGR